jgi:hypothetical protein
MLYPMYDNFLIRVINVQDVTKVLRTDPYNARRVMGRMRKRYGKEKHQPLILQEFIDYTGLKVENVVAILGWK